MERHIRLSLLFIFILIFPRMGFAAGDIPKVFICQSYGAGEVHAGIEMEQGMLKRLEALGYREGENIQFCRFYMDTQTKYKTPEEIKMRAGLALEEIKKADPDLIVIFDDNAFEYVALALAKTKYPIVFNGVNLDPEYYDKKVNFMISREHPGYNITGVKEQSLPFVATQLMKQILPQAKTMAAIWTSYYPFFAQMGREFEEDTREHPERYPIKLVQMYTPKNWQEYQKFTLEANQRKDIDVIFHICAGLYDEQGQGISTTDMIRWIVTHENKPSFSSWVFFIKMGLLGGTGVDFELLGSKTAIQLHRILNGEKPGDIPIEFPMDFYIAINLARAQQLGIEIPFEVLGGAREIYLEMSSYPEYKYKR